MPESRRMRPLLGTFVEVGVDTAGCGAQNAITEAFELMTRVHCALSFQDPASELSRLNRQPGQWLNMSSLARRVLRLARAIGIASRDRFNATVGGQLVAWGVLPDLHDGERIACGRSADIELRGGAVRLRRNVLVTLDGIAKGYAVDLAIAVLLRRGVASGWVNAGGDIRIYGERSLELLQREMMGSLQGLTLLHNAAIASSYAGTDATPDFPGRMVGGWDDEENRVISVVAPRAWKADALTKVAAATPEKCREKVLESFGGSLITSGTRL